MEIDDNAMRNAIRNGFRDIYPEPARIMIASVDETWSVGVDTRMFDWDIPSDDDGYMYFYPRDMDISYACIRIPYPA